MTHRLSIEASDEMDALCERAERVIERHAREGTECPCTWCVSLRDLTIARENIDQASYALTCAGSHTEGIDTELDDALDVAMDRVAERLRYWLEPAEEEMYERPASSAAINALRPHEQSHVDTYANVNTAVDGWTRAGS